MGMIKAVLLLCFLMALADAGFAATQGFMPKAFQGEFVQFKPTSNPREESIEMPASISYQKPRNFRMHSKDGSQDTLYICNKELTIIYNPPFKKGEKGTIRKGNSSKFCYVKIFDALNKGLVSNKIYEVKKLGERDYQLIFTAEAAKEIQFKRVDLKFDNMPPNFKNIETLSLYKSSKKNPIVLKRKSISIENKLDPSLFTFKAPANTDTILME